MILNHTNVLVSSFCDQTAQLCFIVILLSMVVIPLCIVDKLINGPLRSLN